MEDTKIPVTSVDAPSSWNIEEGPASSGVGSSFHPQVLVSLTAPKPLVSFFKGRHFVGGRYVPDHHSPAVLPSSIPSVSSLTPPSHQIRHAGRRQEVRPFPPRVRRNRPGRRGRAGWGQALRPGDTQRHDPVDPPRIRTLRISWCPIRRGPRYITTHPPFRLFGQTGLGQRPSCISTRLTLVPSGH